MNKFFKSMIAVAIAAFTFTSCEDVPAPYEIPGSETETPEIDTPSEAIGDGTLANPFNSIAANNYVASLPSGAESEQDIYIKGKIVSIKEEFNTQYGNATFYISDDGTSEGEFLVYRALYLNNVKFAEGNEQIHVGDEVVICGKLTNYMGNTPETVSGEAYLYSLKCNGGATEEPETPSTGGDGDGKTVTVVAADLGYDNAADMTTVTLSDGTTLTFDAGGNQNGPKYYNTGKAIRMYPKNSMKINSSKKIASVEMTVDVYNGVTYNASGDITSTSGTKSVADNKVSFSGVNAQECTITNASGTTGAASQIRMTQLKITFAE